MPRGGVRLLAARRRVSGRKQGSESLVLRGGVRLLAAPATRREGISAEELAPRDPEQWRQRRSDLGRRRQARAQLDSVADSP